MTVAAPTRKFAALLEGFFTDRLIRQRQASPHTVAAYRDTFRLLLHHAHVRLKKTPSALALADVDVRFIGEFLDHLEKHRGNGSRTRNARLAAIHSFFRYVALEEPASGAMTQRILAIPSKRWDRLAISFLSRPEIDALLAAPDQETWIGRRDHALLLVAVQTGLRVSELLAVRHQDVVLSTGAHVRCLGKGRKERCTPLTRQTVGVLRRWIKEQRTPAPATVLFPSARGGMLSRDGFEYLLTKHVTTARQNCSSLKDKTVSAHTLRHTTAMQLLQAGVDRSVIALWLGHESMETTQVYLHADLAMKERTLTKTAPFRTRAQRFKPDDELLAFLAAL
ncbi:MAG: tyrosine-type recombinase/integrase [Rhodoglobus sp.]